MPRFKRGEDLFLNGGKITAKYLHEFQDLSGRWYVVAQAADGAIYIRDLSSFPSEKRTAAIDYHRGEN